MYINFKVSALLSVGLGFTLAIISSFTVFLSASPNPPTIIKVIAWNWVITRYLSDWRLLPICGDCELYSVFQGLFYAFIVGLIIYSIVTFCIISLIGKSKN